MRPFQRSPKSIGLLVVMFIVALVLAACGSQAGASGFSAVGDELAGAPEAAGDGDVAAPAASGGGAEEPAQDGGGLPGGDRGNAAPIEQRIIKTGQVTLVVDSPRTLTASSSCSRPSSSSKRSAGTRRVSVALSSSVPACEPPT